MFPNNPLEIVVPKLLPRRRYIGRQALVMPAFEEETREFLEDISDLQDTIDLWDKYSGLVGFLDATVTGIRHQHYGPGPHPSGSPQDVHGGGDEDFSDAEFEGVFEEVSQIDKVEGYQQWPELLDAKGIAGTGFNLRTHARNPVEAYFDFEEGVYRYIKSGRKVPDYRLALGGLRVAKAQERAMRELTVRLANGEISQQYWYDQMRLMMKNQYRAHYIASIGGVGNYDRSEISRFGWRMRPQYRWLDNFLLQIQNGTQPLNAFAIRRAGMYARAGNGIYQNERLRIAERNGMTEARRVLGVTDDHCHPDKKGRPGCVELAAMGFVPIGQAVPIGDASCFSNCLCKFSFR